VQANNAVTQAVPRAEFPISQQPDVHLCRQLHGWRLAKNVLRLTASRLVNIWCIWSGAIRSCLGHIQIQSATETPHVTLGPLFERCLDGSYRELLRTRACGEDIERLSANFPWVDFVDRRIFLMGFDAGVRTCALPRYIETGKHNASQP
jgi:hypothetical protein